MCVCVYDVYFKVQCLTLATPMNGDASCILMNGMTPYYEDTCSFTCNTGYELTGSDTRTCQSDGNWSGSDVVCIRGMYHLLLTQCMGNSKEKTRLYGS